MEFDDIVKSLPPALNSEQNAIYLERFILYHDFEAREKLIEGNLRLIASIINRHFYLFDNKDELFSCGIEALAKVVDNFDLSKNTSFSTYAFDYIRFYIQNDIRSTKIKNRSIMSLSTNFSDDGEFTLEDCIEDGSSNFVKDVQDEIVFEEMLKDISKILKNDPKMPQRSKEIFYLATGLGNENYEKLSFRKIGKIYGISTERVSDIFFRVRKKVAPFLIKKYHLDVNPSQFDLKSQLKLIREKALWN